MSCLPCASEAMPAAAVVQAATMGVQGASRLQQP